MRGTTKKPPDLLRQTFWSCCRLGKGRRWYWVAFWTCNPINDANKEPDAKGRGTSHAAAEAEARKAIGGKQHDWRFQVVETLSRFAEVCAVIDGKQVFTPDPQWHRLRSQEEERAERLRRQIDAVLNPGVESAFIELGLPRTSTAAEVRKAFRLKSFDTHPDRGGEHEAFCRLSTAYRMALKSAEAAVGTNRGS